MYMHVCFFMCPSIFCFRMHSEWFFYVFLAFPGCSFSPATARNRLQPSTTIRNHPQPSAMKGLWPYHWRLLQKLILLEVWKHVQHRFTWQAWLKSVAEPKLSKQEVNQHAHLKSPTQLLMVLICLDALMIRCCYCSTFHEKQRFHVFFPAPLSAPGVLTKISWQAHPQHFGDVRLHFLWQSQPLDAWRRVVFGNCAAVLRQR